jgi:hypothetical protein
MISNEDKNFVEGQCPECKFAVYIRRASRVENCPGSMIPVEWVCPCCARVFRELPGKTTT